MCRASTGGGSATVNREASDKDDADNGDGGSGAHDKDNEGEGEGDSEGDIGAHEKDDKVDESDDPAQDDAHSCHKLRSTTFAGSDLPKTRKIGAVQYAIPPQGQSTVLIQFAGPTQSVKNAMHAFRVVGVFASTSDAAEHAEDLPPLCTFSIPASANCSFGSRISASAGDDQVAFVEDVLRASKRDILKTHTEFETNIARRKDPAQRKELDAEEDATMAQQRARMTATSLAIDAATAENVKAAKKLAKAAGRRKAVRNATRVKRLTAAHALPDQQFAVVAIMSHVDDTEPLKSQWLINVWGAFASRPEAQAYLSDTIQHEACFHNSFVCKMYEWIFPDVMNTREFQMQVRGVYKFQDQQDMWDGAYSSKAEATAVIKQRQGDDDLRKLREEIQAGTSAATSSATSKVITVIEGVENVE